MMAYIVVMLFRQQQQMEMKMTTVVRSVLLSAADTLAIRASVAAVGACVVASLLPATLGTTPEDASTAYTACTT